MVLHKSNSPRQALTQQIARESELIATTAGYFRSRFSDMIERLNRQPAAGDNAACLRLCVEAVDMMLASQSRLARDLSRLASDR